MSQIDLDNSEVKEHLPIKRILSGLNGKRFTNKELKAFVELHYKVTNPEIIIIKEPTNYFLENKELYDDKQNWKMLPYNSTSKESGRAWVDERTGNKWTIKKERDLDMADYGVIKDVEDLLLEPFKNRTQSPSRQTGMAREMFTGFPVGQLFSPEIKFFMKGIFSLFVYEAKDPKQKQLVKTKGGVIKSKAIVLVAPICKFDDRHTEDGQSKPRLHSVRQPAVQWGDLKMHYIHGVIFTDDDPIPNSTSNINSQTLWQQICKRKLKASQVITINNQEQKRVAIEHYGMEKIFSALEKKLIDSSLRGNKLYEVKIGSESWRTHQLVLMYKDVSTGRRYVSGVPRRDDEGKEIQTADHAMAWKFSLTEDEYRHLIVEG